MNKRRTDFWKKEHERGQEADERKRGERVGEYRGAAAGDPAGRQAADSGRAAPILEVDNLSLEAADSGAPLVDGVRFSLGRGESLGLVGESGSGKSLTLRAVLGLLPPGVRRAGGEIRQSGRAAMVFQDPRSALDPLCPVVKQVAEVVRYRQKKNRKAARAEALHLLDQLGLPDSLGQEDRYPHQLSGGQCQRIVIALALACRPDVLLCDEPTTALDVTVQRQIVDLLSRLQAELGFALVFVTHNLAVAAEMCSRIAVMQRGRIVEEGPAEDVLTRPRNPYTQMLVDAVLPLPASAGESGGASSDREKEARDEHQFID
ncbi:ABC transporter ATP-binding protein [Saccharibacillus sp. CPCC 101409]|uniref:ABC transporter ATP-binding protein n=1 Tax=Saccharibacillus sp. CPCC 101409 TaxID=3058041 RepID=UPI002672221F|nr:ABC transporter ATP-binding protein [Saccharibacillus sp. CPCC 101409]MDO3413025.1 ABC transporter ATP-binding protein [Saccharibacillus sp. CPCC 101409]